MYQGERVIIGKGTRQKSGRNLGIRPAMRKHGCNKRAPGDCLSKTQLRAKPKGAVYGVTLVRCRNVNGGGGVQQCALPTPEAPVNDGGNYNRLKVGFLCFYKI